MAVTTGTRIGVYDITAQIGEGGMGAVYRATDTSLGRQVAIKVLPDAFAQDAERLARFEREAKTLAALNHPNIATIYGLERSSGTLALVMELVEADDLSQRIAHGAVPLDEALSIAKQIAEALEAAHEQGIIHRDLKPANIKVRSDGTVKVLDFGLAKAMEPAAGSSPSLSMSPTLSLHATYAGVILGTAAYMSPEQARGRTVDKRTDVWAFGCVLFEMLSSARPFDGEDLAETIGAVIHKDPAWDRLPATTPATVRTVLQRCLQKNPKERIRDIGDVQLALKGAFDGPARPGMAAAQTVAVRRPLWWRALPLMAALVVGALITQGAAMWRQPRVARDVGSRFALDLVPRASNRGRVAVSPDGQRLAVVTDAGLSVRERNVLEPRLVHKAAGVSWPFFSPDGQSIGFYENGQLKRIESKGGTPVVIARVASILFGGAWSHDDTILFGQPQGIMRVNASGGTPELVIAAKPGELVHGAQLLPDGRAVLYSVATRADWSDAQVVAQRIGADNRVVLVNRGYDARYLPTGHLIYGFEGQLFAIAFDAERLAVRGRAESVVQGLQANQNGSASYGISDDGVLAYVRAAGAALRTVVWVDRQGREVSVGAPEREYKWIKVSPDGSQLALGIASETWVYSLGRGVLDRLTSVPAEYSVWSPSGKDLVYYSAAVEGGGVFRQSANSSGPVERLATGHYVPLSWSRDGRYVLYLDFAANLPGNPPPNADLGLLTLDGARAARPLIKTPAQEDNSDLSPDGRWIAIKSNELGDFEVFVRPFPDVDGGRWRLSTAGGVDPVWARDGHALYFREGRAIMEVSVTGSNPAAWGRPVRLFEGDYIFATGPRLFDIASDGRFAMLKRVGGSETSQPGVVVVLNWFEELKQRVPVK